MGWPITDTLSITAGFVIVFVVPALKRRRSRLEALGIRLTGWLILGAGFVALPLSKRWTLFWLISIVLGHGDYHYRHEPIAYGYVAGGGRRGRGARGWYGGNAQSSVIDVPRPVTSREHPTMKPVELIRRCLLNSSRETERVLDPFCGSGSTLIACELTGRRGYGTEIDPRYCDVVVRRFEDVTGKRAVREARPRRR